MARKKLIKVEDLSDVDVRLPAGVFEAKVKEVEPHSGDKADGIMVVFEVTSGKYEGSSTRPHFISTTGKGRYRLVDFFKAINYEYEADGDFELDPDEIIDSDLIIQCEERTYKKDDGSEGKTTDVIGYAEPGSLDTTDGDEKPAKRSRGKKDEEDEKPSRRSRSSKKEEPEEEEEEKPSRRSRGKKDEEDEKPARGKKGKAKKLSEDDVNSMDTSELEDLVAEHDLDVDLGAIRSLSRQRAAVIKAAGDLLE